jgi:hypothetical protein
MTKVAALTPDPPLCALAHISSASNQLLSHIGSEGTQIWKVAMAAIAKALSRVFHSASDQSETLKELAVFCGVGLLVSLLLMVYALDISTGFF